MTEEWGIANISIKSDGKWYPAVAYGDPDWPSFSCLVFFMDAVS